MASRQGDGPASANEDTDEDDMEEVPIPAGKDAEGGPSEDGDKDKKKSQKGGVRGAGRRRLQDPADVYRLRPSKPTPQKVGAPPKAKPKAKQGKRRAYFNDGD